MPASETTLHQAVHTLYSDHHGWLLGWLRRKLGCPHQAEDLAQNTFVRVIKSREIRQLVEPRAFLTVLAQRELYTFWRRRDIEQAYLQVLAALPEAMAPSAEEVVLVRALLAEIDALLDGLPAKVRQTFLMSRLEDMTHVEIAKAMGLSVATIERYMKRALMHCYLGRS